MLRVVDLCEEVLGEVEGGLEAIRHHSSLTTEALIDGAEHLLFVWSPYFQFGLMQWP